MMHPWISPDIAPYFSFLSLLAIFSVVQQLALRGIHRRLVTGTYIVGTLIGCVLLVAGIAAIATGQPWHVQFALGFPGAISFGCFAWALARLGKIYSAAELRRSVAVDL